MVDKKGLNKLDNALAAFIALAGLVYYLCYYDGGLIFLDEGYLLDPVMRVLRGETPYRDFHHFYAPASFYLFALLFKLTGPDLLNLRMFWIFLHILTGVLAYLTARRYSSPIFSFAVALVIIIAPGVWYKGFFVFFPVFSTWLTFRYIDNPNVMRAVAAGIGAGVAFTFRQDVGLYAAIAFIALILYQRVALEESRALAKAVWFICGMSVILLPFFMFFFAKGAFMPMLKDVLLSGQRGTSVNSLPFPPFWSPVDTDVVTSMRNKLFYLPFMVYGVGLVVIIRSHIARKQFPGRIYLAFLTVLGLLVMLQLKNRSDVSHLWQIMPLVCLTFVGLLNGIKAEASSRVFVGRAAASYILLSVFIIWSVTAALTSPASGSIAALKGNKYPLDEPRARVYISEKSANDLKETLAYLRKNAGRRKDDLLAVPDIPILYFLLDKYNPSSYELFRVGMTSGTDIQRQIIREIENKKVTWVIFNRLEVNDGRNERLFSSHSPLLYNYIMSRYKTEAVFGQFLVLCVRN